MKKNKTINEKYYLLVDKLLDKAIHADELTDSHDAIIQLKMIAESLILNEQIKGEDERSKFREIAESLWNLLDDIDTASDMFKPQGESSYKTFYDYAMIKSEERIKYLKSDGYKLFLVE